jgi:hypothetical protein
MGDKYEMRVPKREEIELFLQYAPTLERKVLYVLMTEIPRRPRIFPTLRWNWLEPERWTKDVVHVNLPTNSDRATREDRESSNRSASEAQEASAC